jgi:hypothetical protein
MDVAWHFFATSHDEGACNGIGGRRAIISLARKTSLQNPYEEQIIRPKQLGCTVVKIPSVILEQCTIVDHSKKQ